MKNYFFSHSRFINAYLILLFFYLNSWQISECRYIHKSETICYTPSCNTCSEVIANSNWVLPFHSICLYTWVVCPWFPFQGTQQTTVPTKPQTALTLKKKYEWASCPSPSGPVVLVNEPRTSDKLNCCDLVAWTSPKLLPLLLAFSPVVLRTKSAPLSRIGFSSIFRGYGVPPYL